MADIIGRLRHDHIRMMRLLRFVEAEIEVFENGEIPDYDLVLEIVDYALSYPDLVHHPIEDQVMRRLVSRAPDTKLSVGDLVLEHQRLAATTRRLRAALNNILSDETLPRDWFSGVARDYVNVARKHMQLEEVVFYPAAIAALETSDWRAVEKAVQDVPDPLGRDSHGPEFVALKKKLKA